jgi:hypothetical protein
MEASPLRVFVSYSRDSEEHIAWVTRLANNLEERPEFHVVFDGYDLMPGGDVTHFMEEALRSDRVVVVITPSYVEKAATRTGGVGYESTVISGELLAQNLQDTFVPVLRAGAERPSFLLTKLYVDFRSDKHFDISVRELSEALMRRPRVVRPPKRVHDDAATDSQGVGTQLRDRYQDLRAVLGTAMAALEDYADVVQALIAAGRWSVVMGVAEPAELTHAEARARRDVRIYSAKVSDALIATRHVIVNATLNERDHTLLTQMMTALRSLTDAGAQAERAVGEIRHGKSPKQVFSEDTQMFVDREGSLRTLLSRLV